MDIIDQAPYYKKAWELADDEMSLYTGLPKRGDKSQDQCVTIPAVEPDYAWFPPSQYSQLFLILHLSYSLLYSVL